VSCGRPADQAPNSKGIGRWVAGNGRIVRNSTRRHRQPIERSGSLAAVATMSYGKLSDTDWPGLPLRRKREPIHSFDAWPSMD
jgi:hypothetical protein